jgi:hypothetical protein
MNVCGITGLARVGKDTLGQYLIEKHGYARWAMAGPLKAMVEVGLGLKAEDFESSEAREAIIPWLGCSIRHIWQTLGTDWGRMRVHEDLWLIIAERAITRMIDNGAPGVVITDLRFENELAMVRKMGGVVVHLKTNRKSNLTGAAAAHVSEKGVEIGPLDRVLFNSGTIEELYASAEVLLHSLSLSAGWQAAVAKEAVTS